MKVKYIGPNGEQFVEKLTPIEGTNAYRVSYDVYSDTVKVGNVEVLPLYTHRVKEE